MKEATTRAKGAPAALPSSAPLVRVTAGIGSPTQKTWNLRKPITLIGAQRPASIVLHDREVCKAHCVIVNTGTDVLIKDLHTPSGTLQNKERIDLAVLSDGDVVTVGSTSIQIAIQAPNDASGDSGVELEYIDPKRFPKPFVLRLEHTDQRWKIEDAVTVIGRFEQSVIRLDQEAVSSRHAVLFRFGGSIAVYDLASRAGTKVNGFATEFAVLQNGDRITLGPLTLVVEVPDGFFASAERTKDQGSCGKSANRQARSPAERQEDSPSSSHPAEPVSPSRANGDRSARSREEETVRELSKIAGDLAALQRHLGTSWDRLNDGSQAAEQRAAAERNNGLAAKEAALDAKDALIRGQMHEVTRYHEELIERERQLAAQLARIQALRDEVAKAERAQSERTAETEKRWEDLRRREHVLAQRWARVSGIKCPNCDTPINLGPSGVTEGS
jgi:pSer/pThr/pTyr-binding forkhead associated (FHA) protein